MIRIGKKLAAVLLAVAMAVTFVPVMGAGTVYADEPGEAGGEITWTPLPGSDTINYYLDEEGTLTLQLAEGVESATTPDYSYDQSPFYGNGDIKSVIVGDGITKVGGYLFTGLTGLKSVDLPEGLTSIGKGAFGECTALSSVDLPEGLTSIGEVAFALSGIRSMEIPDSVTEMGAGVFNECYYLKTAKLSSRITDIFPRTFMECCRLKTVEIPDGVKLIGEDAFTDCTELRELIIPESVEKIESSAFFDCISLEKVTFKGGFCVEMGAFWVCNFTAYYPLHNSTWDEDAIGTGYGGKVKWIGYCNDPKPAAAVKENVKAATTTQEGSYQEVVYCSVCGEKLSSETVTIPKLPKKANPLTIKAKTATVGYSKLKKSNQTLAVTKVITFTKKGQGTMTYTKASGNKKITINKKTGKVTIKKGLKKGTYKVKVKAKAAGNANYKASAVKTVTFKVKVK